jgi:hypothetical protein
MTRKRATNASHLLLAAALLALPLLLPRDATASEVKLFRQQSQAAFLRGTLDGMSIDTLGTLRIGPHAERLSALAEPFVLSAADHRDGWVVGTGNAGKVLLVKRDGSVQELFATAEPEIFAVAVDAQGVVWAGSSPKGKVYRYADGKASVWFDPQQTYIWKLVPGERDELFVATGTEGKLFHVRGGGKGEQGKGEVLWKGDDPHVRSLVRLPGGDLLAGTAGEGRLVHVSARGEARMLFDAVEPEMVALAVGDDGIAWAAAVASEASQAPLAAPASSQSAKATGKEKGSGGAAGGGESAEAEGEASVTVNTGPGQPVGSRPPGFGGPRSEILRIDLRAPGGPTVTSVARLQEDTVETLRWRDGRLWIGTGVDGKLYSLRGNDLVLESNVEEKQIMALLDGGGGDLAFVTTNASALYRTHTEKHEGTYTSPVLDAGQIARFGTFRWMGEAPPGADVRFAFRSGISAEPDAGWSTWTEPRVAERGGREIALTGVPSGRYFQWRAVVKAGRDGESPQLAAAEVSYLQANLAPRITALTALDPGQILVPYSFNPTSQTFEPVHPNREGIFTTLEQAPEDGNDRTKTLWKQGYRTLRWKAEDPNGDPLTYKLSFRREPAAGSDPQREAAADRTGVGSDGGAASGATNAATLDSGWLPMADDLTDGYYSFDETALPDGVYRFRLQASDAPRDRANPEQPEGAAPSAAAHDTPELTDVRISEPVVVDHTPPRLVSVHREGDVLHVEVEDAWNPLREASYSLAGAPWQAAKPDDGLLDGRHEVLDLPVPRPAKGRPAPLVILRVMDAAFNTVTFDLSAEAAR